MPNLPEASAEDRQSHYRMLLRRGMPEEHARRLATGRSFALGLNTDSTFLSGSSSGDGFGGDKVSRKIARANAKAAGLNPDAMKYCPSLCPKGEPLSPKAWVGGRSDLKARCEENGWGCEGAVNVKRVAPDEPGPLDGPYEVAPKIVAREVDAIIGDNHKDVTPQQKRDLVEATKTRLAGAQD